MKETDLSKNLVESGFPFGSGKFGSGLTSGAGDSTLPAISKGLPSVAFIDVAIGPPGGWSRAYICQPSSIAALSSTVDESPAFRPFCMSGADRLHFAGDCAKHAAAKTVSRIVSRDNWRTIGEGVERNYIIWMPFPQVMCRRTVCSRLALTYNIEFTPLVIR